MRNETLPYKIKIKYYTYTDIETTHLELFWSTPEKAIKNIDAIRSHKKYRDLLKGQWANKEKIEDIQSSYRPLWWYKDDLAEGLYLENEEGELIYTNCRWTDDRRYLISIELILDYSYYF